jgi:hypothetical protein
VNQRPDRLSLVVGLTFVLVGIVFLLDALGSGSCAATTWCRWR